MGRSRISPSSTWASKKVTRLVERTPVRFYGFSPDEKSVAYTVLKGWEANSQQPNFDLAVVDLATGAKRVRSRRTSGSGTGSSGPGPRTAGASPTSPAAVPPSARGPIDRHRPGRGRSRPGRSRPRACPASIRAKASTPRSSTRKGENLYAVGDGELWRVDAASGKGAGRREDPGLEDPLPVQPFGRGTLLTPDGRTVWVLARQADPPVPGPRGPTRTGRTAARPAFFAVDLTTGKSRRRLVQEDKSYIADLQPRRQRRRPARSSLSATDQQHLHDLWIVGLRRPARRGRSRT